MGPKVYQMVARGVLLVEQQGRACTALQQSRAEQRSAVQCSAVQSRAEQRTAVGQTSRADQQSWAELGRAVTCGVG